MKNRRNAADLGKGNEGMFTLSAESKDDVNKWRKVANPTKSTVELKRVEVQKHQVSKSGSPF